jgi:N-acetylgalactosamine-6-sulfatase
MMAAVSFKPQHRSRLTAKLCYHLGLFLLCRRDRTNMFVSGQQQPPPRPNFILIFADDLGFGDLGCYGHPYAKTPNIDRLAKEGTLFRQFNVNGNVCPVTRAGLMTSRNPSWFPNFTEDYGFLNATTITKILKNAGYVTGHVGKWNIGPNETMDGVEYGIDDVRLTGGKSEDEQGREGNRFQMTIELIETYNQGQQPFYINLWIFTPHTPIGAPQSFLDEFANLTVDTSLFDPYTMSQLEAAEASGENIDERMRVYLADIYAMDVQVGKLLKKLDELGISNNTVVAFSSDNGPNVEDIIVGSAGGLRGGKHTFYE